MINDGDRYHIIVEFEYSKATGGTNLSSAVKDVETIIGHLALNDNVYASRPLITKIEVQKVHWGTG